MIRRYLYTLLLGALLGAGAVLGAQYYDRGAQSEVTKPAPELKNENAAAKPCEKIVVYRDKVKKEFGLPKDVVANPKIQVADATRIHAAMHSHTVSATYNFDDGRVQQFVRHDPLPWLAFDVRREVTVGYAFTDDGAGAFALGRVSFMQIKAVDFSVYGELTSDGSWGAGVDATVEF